LRSAGTRSEFDISPLAEFVSRVKTTVFAETDLDRLDAWARRVPTAIHPRKTSIRLADYAEAGYYKYLDDPTRWRLRKAIEQGLRSAIRLGNRLESFGRCVVLRTAQWALDGRANLPPIDEFRETLGQTATGMLLAPVRYAPPRRRT
jgi:hypothetical protein